MISCSTFFTSALYSKTHVIATDRRLLVRVLFWSECGGSGRYLLFFFCWLSCWQSNILSLSLIHLFHLFKVSLTFTPFQIKRRYVKVLFAIIWKGCTLSLVICDLFLFDIPTSPPSPSSLFQSSFQPKLKLLLLFACLKDLKSFLNFC